MSVLLETSFGDVVVDLFTSRAPLACTNFLKLCKLKHYNNALFQQVSKGKPSPTQITSPKSRPASLPQSGRKQATRRVDTSLTRWTWRDESMRWDCLLHQTQDLTLTTASSS